MSKLKEQWNDLPLYEKVFLVLLLVLSCGMMILAYFYEQGYDLLLPLGWLTEFFFVCASVVNWRNNRIMAYLQITAAVIMGIMVAYGTIHYFD